jgi:tetratricopeptide (TPR) repeat protein
MRLHQRPGLFMADDVQQWDSAAREEAMAVARYVAADRESGGEWGGSAVVLAGRTDAGEWNMMLEGSPVLTRRISLGVLDEGEVGVFLREALRVDEVPQAISRAVASQTGGVPSLLVAASERLVEKIPAGQGVGPALQESVLGGLDLPRDVEASVIQRASGLRREARLVVIGCHLAGRSVTERALGAMLLTLDVSENPSALIGELDRGGWVVRDDGAVRVPALSGRTVAEQVGRDEIAAVATALARAMEAQGEAAERTMALDLVGGDVERARRAAVRVVEEGRGAGARERYRLLDLACRRGDLTSDRTLHVRLLEELAGAAIERGLFEEGRTRLQALAGEGDLQPEDRARVRVRLANAHRRCGDLMEAEKEYVAVLQGLDPGSALALEAESDLAVVEREEGRLARSIGRSEKLLQQSDERLAGFRGRVLRNLGAAISERGDHRKATELFRDAAAAYRGAGFGFEALVCDYSAATGLVRLGSFKTALRDLESILQAFTEGDHALGVALSLQALGVSVIASGYPARGLDIAREAVRALSRLGNASELCRAWIDVAWAQSAMADFDEALAALDRSQLAAALGTSKRHAIQLPLLRGEVLARLGDCDGARAAIEEARRLASGDEALWSLEADVWAAWLDKAPGSQRVLEKALERFEAAENGWGAVLSRLLLAELLLREGAAGPVVEVLDGMGAQDDDSVLSSFGISRSRALLVRGRARTALGDAKGAESDFAECLATARDRLQRDEAWQGLARLGLLDLAAGRREQALVRLRSAVDSVRGITKMLCKQSGSLFMNDAERGKLLADVVSALAV